MTNRVSLLQRQRSPSRRANPSLKGSAADDEGTKRMFRHGDCERSTMLAKRQNAALGEIEDRYQRELADLRSRLPKQEARAAPDLYEDPNGFVGHNVRQAVDPIKSEIGQMREYFRVATPSASTGPIRFRQRSLGSKRAAHRVILSGSRFTRRRCNRCIPMARS